MGQGLSAWGFWGFSFSIRLFRGRERSLRVRMEGREHGLQGLEKFALSGLGFRVEG